MKRVLVVGGAGYIGSALIPQLVDEDYHVSVLDTFWFGDNLPSTITKIKKNVMDTTVEDYKGYEQVIFFAGLSNDPMSEFMPKDCFIQNGAAPAYCAYLSKMAGVSRFIYASTCSVYGWSPDGNKDIDSTITVSYPYGVSKYTGECGVLALRDEFFHAVAIRMGTVCGASPRVRFDLLLNTMYKNIRTSNEIKISNPDIKRPVLWIDDACMFYKMALRGIYDNARIINAVSFNTTLGALARNVAQWAESVFGTAPRFSISFVGDMRSYAVYSTVTIMREPKEILDQLHKHYSGISDFTKIEYSNAEVFKKLISEGKYV